MEWRTELVPRMVLNKLEQKGYSVVAMTGVGQTCIWTVHKPAADDGAKTDTTKQVTTTLNGQPTYS